MLAGVAGTVDGKLCGGLCPNAADQCRVAPADNACKCIPPEANLCGGKPDKQGLCGGPCPDPVKPQCQLTVTATGAKVSDCGPPPCGSDATGQCTLGACPNPATQQCKLDASGACNCDPPSCGLVGVDTCGGVCPPGRNCAPLPVVGGALRCRCL